MVQKKFGLGGRVGYSNFLRASIALKRDVRQFKRGDIQKMTFIKIYLNCRTFLLVVWEGEERAIVKGQL